MMSPPLLDQTELEDFVQEEPGDDQGPTQSGHHARVASLQLGHTMTPMKIGLCASSTLPWFQKLSHKQNKRKLFETLVAFGTVFKSN